MPAFHRFILIFMRFSRQNITSRLALVRTSITHVCPTSIWSTMGCPVATSIFDAVAVQRKKINNCWKWVVGGSWGGETKVPMDNILTHIPHWPSWNARNSKLCARRPFALIYLFIFNFRSSRDPKHNKICRSKAELFDDRWPVQKNSARASCTWVYPQIIIIRFEDGSRQIGHTIYGSWSHSFRWIGANQLSFFNNNKWMNGTNWTERTPGKFKLKLMMVD